jgi:O-antigen ligase
MSLTGLAFLASYAYGLLVAFVRHPIYGLFTYVLVLFLHPPSRWWGENLPGVRWSLIAALVTFAAYVVKSDKSRYGSPAAHGVFVAYGLLVFWMAIQTPWAMRFDEHKELVILFAKYLLLAYLICRMLDTEQRIRIFLWAYVLGSSYLGWVAFSAYSGGRFEGFGGPNMGEANSGALALLIAIFAAAPLFLHGKLWERGVLIALMPFIVNGMITAVSRSAFVALLAGGAIYLWFSPKKLRRRIMLFALLGGVLFMMLTNPEFWARMTSLKHAGEGTVVIESDIGSTTVYDAGAGRISVMKAQWEMFLDYPLGTGHRGTVDLSRLYLPDDLLSGSKGFRGRASHNTFLTMLVEQGIVGGLVYVYVLWWIYRRIRGLRAFYGSRSDFTAAMVPTLAAILVSITVGDVFVDYLKMEPRIWFIALLMSMTDQINRSIRETNLDRKERIEKM